jgi:hypothetical protein
MLALWLPLETADDELLLEISKLTGLLDTEEAPLFKFTVTPERPIF